MTAVTPPTTPATATAEGSSKWWRVSRRRRHQQWRRRRRGAGSDDGRHTADVTSDGDGGGERQVMTAVTPPTSPATATAEGCGKWWRPSPATSHRTGTRPPTRSVVDVYSLHDRSWGDGRFGHGEFYLGTRWIFQLNGHWQYLTGQSVKIWRSFQIWSGRPFIILAGWSSII